LYLDVPKKDWNKYHAPYKDTISCVPARTTKVCTVDRILPEPYFEKTPFPARVKEHSTLVSVLKKSAKKAVEPDEQITIKSLVAIVNDLVTKNVEDEHIAFCEDASNIVSHTSRSRKTSVHVLSVRIGDHCYYGLCDIGASSSAIPYQLYREMMACSNSPLGTPRGRYDEYSNKSSLSYKTKVYRTSRRKPNFRR
jgi:hypothetical protein